VIGHERRAYNQTMHRVCSLLAVAGLICACVAAQAGKEGSAAAGNRMTIIYDAFADRSDLTLDWGYAALVEFGGKRILFDTGNNAAIFEANVRRLHIDLRRLDFVVLSHRHGDHTSGLRYVLSVNPRVPIYGPADESFLDTTPAAFLTRNADAELPAKMRYFAGKLPATPPGHGTAWPGVHIQPVERRLDVGGDIHLISTMSETPGFRDMSEVSLVLDTPRGPIVVVGCSHPGIQNILANLTQQTKRGDVYEIVGGMHTLLSTPAEAERTVLELVDTYHVQRMAPGHCTGERMFRLLQKRLGAEYIYAGIGESFPM
jgi:7,8-dihydropterin-6-yl-methyl-4-(beta-D-ribofuranosyl)aminobenzene 5'-phosphate synthase